MYELTYKNKNIEEYLLFSSIFNAMRYAKDKYNIQLFKKENKKLVYRENNIVCAIARIDIPNDLNIFIQHK